MPQSGTPVGAPGGAALTALQPLSTAARPDLLLCIVEQRTADIAADRMPSRRLL